MEKLVIDRDQVNPDRYDYRSGDCCYIGRYAQLLNEPKDDGLIYSWSADKLGLDLSHAITNACFRADEKEAIRLFAKAGVEVEFV